MPQTILYYPTINIHDGAWLRNAVLYWDEVSSIIPYENYGGLSPELVYLKDEGVYSPVYPCDLFYSEHATDFCNSIKTRIAAYDRAITKDHKLGKKKKTACRKEVYAPALYELIHYKKLPKKLLKYFMEERFISDCNCDGWMQIDSRIAQIYMRTLAEYSIKCSPKDMVLGTDTLAHSREIYNHARSRTELQTQCCKINILNCLPQPAMDVSFEDILHFKRKRKDELDAFREKIRELETNIYRATSYEEIKHHETHFTENWQHYSKDYYKVLGESKIPFFLTSLLSIVAIPSINEALSSRLGPFFATALQTAAPLVQIGIGYYEYKNKLHPNKADGSFSYIFRANKEGLIHIEKTEN